MMLAMIAMIATPAMAATPKNAGVLKMELGLFAATGILVEAEVSGITASAAGKGVLVGVSANVGVALGAGVLVGGSGNVAVAALAEAGVLVTDVLVEAPELQGM